MIGEDAVDTYELRVLLETEALRQSIPLLDADDIAQARGTSSSWKRNQPC